MVVSIKARTPSPQLATLVTEPPTGPEWLHEIKYDGYRIIAEKRRGEVKLITRSGLDWTARFSSVADAVRQIKTRDLVLDGEVVVFDENGKSDFGLLQAALKGRGPPVTYVVFDLIGEGAKDLRHEPLKHRKVRLSRALAVAPPCIMVGETLEGDGRKILEAICQHGLEGMVSKRRDAAYVSVRSRTWLKCKCGAHDEFVILGYRPSRSRQRAFSSLLLGSYDERGRLIYRGRVGTGFDQRLLEDVMKRMKRLERTRSSSDHVPRSVARAARWVEPRLVADVAYTELTREGILRHPVFHGLRAEKPAREVSMANRVPVSEDTREARGKKGSDTITRHGVRLTHPLRVLFPESGATKCDLADYYAAVAPLMLPHVRGRPLSLLRCPDGSGEACFFQKHARPGLPKEMSLVPVRDSSGKTQSFVGINTRAALVSAAQVGAIELHIWGARAAKSRAGRIGCSSISIQTRRCRFRR